MESYLHEIELNTSNLLNKIILIINKINTQYPWVPLLAVNDAKQDLVRNDDSFPCLDLLSVHENPDGSAEFLIV